MKGTTGGKNWPFVESQCDEGTLRNLGILWKIGLLGKMSVRKGHFCENWAAEVKTGLIQK